MVFAALGIFSRELTTGLRGADLPAGQSKRLKNTLMPESRLLIGLPVLAGVLKFLLFLARDLIVSHKVWSSPERWLSPKILIEE
jgi:hypothetical protein